MQLWNKRCCFLVLLLTAVFGWKDLNGESVLAMYVRSCAACVVRMIRFLLGEGLVTSEGALHAMQKRIMKPSFNTRSTASEFVRFYLAFGCIYSGKRV